MLVKGVPDEWLIPLIVWYKINLLKKTFLRLDNGHFIQYQEKSMNWTSFTRFLSQEFAMNIIPLNSSEIHQLSCECHNSDGSNFCRFRTVKTLFKLQWKLVI